MSICALCKQDYDESELVKIGEEIKICVDEFCDELLGCLDGDEASEITKRLKAALKNKYAMADLIDRAPDEIRIKWCGGGLLIDNYDKAHFCDLLKEESYPKEDIVDFIGSKATDDFNELMDFLIVLTIYASDLGVYWDTLCADYAVKYGWQY